MDNRIASPRSVPPAPTTPPRRPTSEDIPLLQFAQTIELAFRDLFDLALNGGALDGGELQVFLAARENHEEYSSAMSPLLGTAAPQQRDDTVYAQYEDRFAATDLTGLAEAAYDLESTAVATYLDLLGHLKSTASAATVTSILLVESRLCTVFASMAGKGDDLDAMLMNSATSLASNAPLSSEPATADTTTADSEA